MLTSNLTTLARHLKNTWYSLSGVRTKSRRRVQWGSAIESLESRELLTVYTVDTLEDVLGAGKVTSLRHALELADKNAGADTIQFAAGVNGTMTLNYGELQINGPVEIIGNGASNTIINANAKSRVFDVTSTAGNVTFNGLTVTNGRTTADLGLGSGSGIAFFSTGILTVINCAVTGNTASGEFIQGVGIDGENATKVYISGSTISGNSTTLGDPGNSPGGGGAVSLTSGSLELVNSTVSGNSSVGTTGGVVSFSGSLTLTNTTVTGNSSSAAGGVGGIQGFSNVITLNNSIVAGNSNSNGFPDLLQVQFSAQAPVLNLNHSLIGNNDGSLATATTAGSLIGTKFKPLDPKLGPLQNNGGQTATHALLPGSPAYNAGDNTAALTSNLTLDQRGSTRIVANTVDIGSFEAQFPMVSFDTAQQIVTEGQGSVTITVNLSQAVQDIINVPITLSGTAQNGADYSVSATTLILKGATTASATISLVDDTAVEGNENIIVTLGTPSGGNAILTGITSQTITITDNDQNPTNNLPSISPQTFTVAENSALNTPVGTVVALPGDAGQTLTYAITGGNSTGASSAVFAIDSSTGQITVKDPAALNFEVTPTFSLTVMVTDNGTPVQANAATITINLTDVNETPTIAPAQTFTIPENSPVGTLVGSVAFTDPDANPTRTFSIVSTSSTSLTRGGVFSTLPAGTFAIDSTGKITVANAAAIDFETNSLFLVTVSLADGGNPPLSATGTVTISVTDVNENQTITPGQTFTIPENSPTGTNVGTVLVTGPGSSQNRTFSLGSIKNTATGGFFLGAFAIDSSGKITVANPAPLDFETNSSLTVEVTVTDNGTPPLSDTETVTINLTNVNEAPVITALTRTLPENPALNSLVETVIADDPDAGQTLTYSGSDPSGTFTINPITGNITVANPTLLDFETRPQHFFTVTVTDNGTPPLSATAQLEIRLSDIDEPPVFGATTTFSIAENSPINSVVGTVFAVDPDFLEIPTYSGSDPSGTFAIDPLTGKITVANAILLDFETQPHSRTFNVSATSNGLSATVPITINVIDVNDAPAITPGQPFAIPENSPVGTPVGIVASSDPDAGQIRIFKLGSVKNSVTGAVISGAFAMDLTGQLTVANPTALDFETNPSFAVEVTVTDSGTPSLSDTKTVTVNLTDVIEGPVISVNSTALTSVRLKSTVKVDDAATYSPAGTVGLNGAILTIADQLGTGATSTRKDTLAIGKGTSAGSSLSISGGKLMLQSGRVKTQIGTVSGGKQGQSLSIKFNDKATNENVQDVLRNITFKSTDRVPGNRTISIQITNVGGLNSNTATREIQLVK